jgi:hypothetical protein
MNLDDFETPKFAWIVLTILGCVDIFRGIMHTVLLEYAATNIAGLDLSVAGQDQMFLLGVFGISNYLTGIMFILIGLKARNLVPIMLLVTPVVYLLSSRIILLTAQPQSAFAGQSFMLVYIVVCLVTFISIFIHSSLTKRKK